MAPIVEEVGLTPLNNNSWVNGSQLPQNFPVFRDKKGEYHLADTINTYGKVGLSVKTYDKREGANNKYQPHRIEVYLNNKLYHYLEFEELSYDFQATSNFISDYRNSRLNLGNFVKLYKNYGDPEVPVHSLEPNKPTLLVKVFEEVQLKTIP